MRTSYINKLAEAWSGRFSSSVFEFLLVSFWGGGAERESQAGSMPNAGAQCGALSHNPEIVT